MKSLELVGALKVKIEEKEGVPREEQRLIFGGKELCDACTLASCGIAKEGSVHLQLRLRGGIGTGQRGVIVGLGAGYNGASVTVEEVRADGYLFVRKQDGKGLVLPSNYVVSESRPASAHGITGHRPSHCKVDGCSDSL